MYLDIFWKVNNLGDLRVVQKKWSDVFMFPEPSFVFGNI